LFFAGDDQSIDLISISGLTCTSLLLPFISIEGSGPHEYKNPWISVSGYMGAYIGREIGVRQDKNHWKTMY
jgi:hypothetical protein